MSEMEVSPPSASSTTSTATFNYYHIITENDLCPVCPDHWSTGQFHKIFGTDTETGDEQAEQFAVDHDLLPAKDARIICPHGMFQTL